MTVHQSATADHPLDSGLSALRALLATRVISPSELCQEALRRLAAWEPHLNAFITVCDSEAMSRARALERRGCSAAAGGRLWGVPVAIKDNLDVAGIRTTGGSAAIDYIATESAPTVRRLVDAGAVVVGKTNVPELAYGPVDTYAFGATWNPWKPGHFAGGSSMGSGAAVAAGIVPAALGSDTTGSIRNPASWSGITGLKPTRGLLPNRGMIPLAPMLDHIGPMARSALDCAVVLDELTDRDPDSAQMRNLTRSRTPYADCATAPALPARIGVLGELFSTIPEDVVTRMEEALDVLADLGNQLVEVTVPMWFDAVDAALVVVDSQAAANHGHLLSAAGDRLQPQVRARLDDRANDRVARYDEAVLVSREFSRHLDRLLDEVDFLVLPARERTAPPMERSGQRPGGERGHVFNTPFNLAGSPAVVIPVGFDRWGLPVGLQLAASRWRDPQLLQLAHAYQTRTEWHAARPVLPGSDDAGNERRHPHS